MEGTKVVREVVIGFMWVVGCREELTVEVEVEIEVEIEVAAEVEVEVEVELGREVSGGIKLERVGGMIFGGKGKGKEGGGLKKGI